MKSNTKTRQSLDRFGRKKQKASECVTNDRRRIHHDKRLRETNIVPYVCLWQTAHGSENNVRTMRLLVQCSIPKHTVNYRHVFTLIEQRDTKDKRNHLYIYKIKSLQIQLQCKRQFLLRTNTAGGVKSPEVRFTCYNQFILL